MIEPITITGLKLELDDTMKKYAFKKIGKLDRYLPRHARKTATAEVKLRQIDQAHGNKYEAEAVVFVPEKTFVAKDSTMNVLAALDIVETKLAAQLRKYKAQQVTHIGHRGALSRFKRSYAREAQN